MQYIFLNKLKFPDDFNKIDDKDIPVLADEIRDFIIKKTMEHGGHLASNLGVVELTLAIYRNFDLPNDHLIFDVGHQCYTHKILSGRIDGFDRLREIGGMSGFTKSSESPYDAFGAGHSSTSLSAALGFAEADCLDGNGKYTIAVIGDGAYTGGMIHEALNNCRRDLKLIIILNENEMSISKNIGRFAEQFARIRNTKQYYKTKKETRNFIRSIPVLGDLLFRSIRKIKKILKNKLYGSNYFEDLGFYYLGPADGNDFKQVSVLLKEAKEYGKSTVIHLKTKKGKGMPEAEKEPGKFHSIRPDTETVPDGSFSEEFCRHLSFLAKGDERICAVTASMATGTHLDIFEADHAKRFFDVGIAEEHALTFCAGLSASGKIPVFCVYSSFLQRGFDNLIHDIALQNRTLVLGIDRCGINSSDGATHHGIFDVAFLSEIPKTEIFAPISYASLRSALEYAVNSSKVCAVRYDNSPEKEEAIGLLSDGLVHSEFLLTDIPDGEIPEGLIITYGRIFTEALKAAEKLRSLGKNVRVAVLEKLKPYDEAAEKISGLVSGRSVPMLFLEEGIRYGGAGEILLDELNAHGTLYSSYDILALDNDFADYSESGDKYDLSGISAKFIVEKMLKLYEK